jgi:hypothetical protein
MFLQKLPYSNPNSSNFVTLTLRTQQKQTSTNSQLHCPGVT